MTEIERGRADLARWTDEGPHNFFEVCTALKALIERDWSPEHRAARLPRLSAFGAVAAGPLDRAAIENNLSRNLPALDPYDGVGRAASPVVHHPSYHEAGRLIYGSGVMEAYGESPVDHRFIQTLFFLSSHVGEAGHNCPLACTAGAIRALQRVGSPAQRARYLPPLLDPCWDTNYSGAQFLTEVQGGSDVGANATRAELQPDGHWRIFGEKWFCSNADADLILLTARVEGGGAGTRGLGLFLVPAVLPDGARNTYRLRRLKDKLGTRSMASAEIDFDGTYAEALGPVERGFNTVMEEVITTSRVYNAFSVTGLAQRAWIVARSYARHRRAFGQPLEQYPLVRQTLAYMGSDAEACLAGSWLLAGLWERLDRGEASADERAFFRVAVNLNKLRTAILAHDVINRGIEVLGGNGAIESFSVLPRLLRDNVVCENWEGTHNVLCAQVLRDCRRLQVHEGFFRVLEGALGAPRLIHERAALDRSLQADDALASLQMRSLADRLASLVQLAGLAGVEHPAVLARARLFERRHLQAPTEPDSAWLALVDSCMEQG